MLPRHNTMFVVVSAGVWGKNSLNNWCGYSWFCLSFFVPLLSCVTHSSCSLPVCLCLLEKRRKLRLFCGAQVFFRVFFTPPLKRDSHFTVASRLPPFDRKKRRKIAPFLQIQASSMKLIVVFFLYTKVFHFDKKKRKKALRPDSFLFQWFWHFLKYFNSNHNLPGYSLFSKCFSWFFYLGVHGGTGVFCVVFVILLPSRVTHPRARFAPASVWPKKAEKLRLFCRSRPP